MKATVRYAILASDGQTVTVRDSLKSARLGISFLRYRETHCTEGNTMTGRTYRIMRGTSAQDWKAAR
jgi:predicted nucleotidyltransferase